MRFRRREGTRFERSRLELLPRSAYVLAGEARSRWQHSIPPVDALRYSITFRSVRDSAVGPAIR
jgi:alkylated DNA repair dioxygenase AlkB